MFTTEQILPVNIWIQSLQHRIEKVRQQLVRLDGLRRGGLPGQYPCMVIGRLPAEAIRMSFLVAKPTAVILAMVVLGLSTAARAECGPVEAHACVMTLHGANAPAASASCSHDTWKDRLHFLQPGRFSDHDGDGWHETVLKLDLEPSAGCTCAVFRVFFEKSGGYSVDIGNSPTNNGWGGDDSSTRYDAELQVFDGRLLIFSSDGPPGTLFPTDVTDLTLPELAGRVLELEICDQMVRFRLEGPAGEPGPSGKLTAHSTQSLFRLGTRPSGSPIAPAVFHSLYAGFNRVIDRIDGPPAKKRSAAAVRRVEFFLRP